MYILANGLFFPLLIIVISFSCISEQDKKSTATFITLEVNGVKEKTFGLYAEKLNLIVKTADHFDLYWEPEHVFPCGFCGQ